MKNFLISLISVLLITWYASAASNSLFEQIFDGTSTIDIPSVVNKPSSISSYSVKVIDANFEQIKNSLVKYSISKRIDIYDTAIVKLQKLANSRTVKSEKDALNYLKGLAKKEKESLEKDTWLLIDLFWADTSICNTDYILQDWDCVKKVSKTYSYDDSLPNKSCSVSNGYGKQYWYWTYWSSCQVKWCNSWYYISNNRCVKWSSSSSRYYSDNCYNDDCSLRTTSCSVYHWDGKQVRDWTNWSKCYVTSCDSWYYLSGNNCVNRYDYRYDYGNCYNDDCSLRTTSCSVSHWDGQKVWDGNSWSKCYVTSCDSWYRLSKNSCVRDSYYYDYNGDYYCYDWRCDYEDSRYCSVSHWSWRQYYNWYNWTICRVTSCDSWYYVSWNSCARGNYYYNNDYYYYDDYYYNHDNNYCYDWRCDYEDSRYCSVSNWSGRQFYNGNSWSICYVNSCNSWYYVSGNSCVKDYSNNCNGSSMHYENDSCYENNRSCYIAYWVWERTWNWSNWSDCRVVSCNSWYYSTWYSCLKN